MDFSPRYGNKFFEPPERLIDRGRIRGFCLGLGGAPSATFGRRWLLRKHFPDFGRFTPNELKVNMKRIERVTYLVGHASRQQGQRVNPF